MLVSRCVGKIPSIISHKQVIWNFLMGQQRSPWLRLMVKKSRSQPPVWTYPNPSYRMRFQLPVPQLVSIKTGFLVTPWRLTWNLQITHLESKMIFQTSMIMVHVNLPGCTIQNRKKPRPHLHGSRCSQKPPWHEECPGRPIHHPPVRGSWRHQVIQPPQGVGVF